MKQVTYFSLLACLVSACASNSPGDRQVVYAPAPPIQAMSVAMQNENNLTENPSLWAITPNALLSMRRAKEVGDLLTVVVEMDDKASMQNSLSRSRNSKDSLNVDALFGLPDWADGILPGAGTLSPGVDMNRKSDLNGNGAVRRAEKVTFRLAARIIGVERNGNLIIEGYQQTRVSNEVRYLTVSGVIRAQDISRMNTVSYEKIADAQMAYISSGNATGAVKRSVIPRLLDKFVPF